jgi:hypothetical protein
MSQVPSQMQEVDVNHVNALLQAVSDQRNSALNTVAQVQAENTLLRQRVEALLRENQELVAKFEAAAKSAEKTKAA